MSLIVKSYYFSTSLNRIEQHKYYIVEEEKSRSGRRNMISRKDGWVAGVDAKNKLSRKIEERKKEGGRRQRDDEWWWWKKW